MAPSLAMVVAMVTREDGAVGVAAAVAVVAGLSTAADKCSMKHLQAALMVAASMGQAVGAVGAVQTRGVVGQTVAEGGSCSPAPDMLEAMTAGCSSQQLLHPTEAEEQDVAILRMALAMWALNAIVWQVGGTGQEAQPWDRAQGLRAGAKARARSR